MFIAISFIIAQNWKLPKRSSKFVSGQTVVYPYNEKLLSIKKDQITEESQKPDSLVKVARHRQPHSIRFLLYETSLKSQAIKSEIRFALPQGAGQANVHDGSASGDENVPKWVYVYGCTI